MTQKTISTTTPTSTHLYQDQEPFTVCIKNMDEYVGVTGINEALDFIDGYVIACNDPIADGSGITIEPGELTIHRGNPAEVKSQFANTKPKARRKVATV